MLRTQLSAEVKLLSCLWTESLHSAGMGHRGADGIKTLLAAQSIKCCGFWGGIAGC